MTFGTIAVLPIGSVEPQRGHADSRRPNPAPQSPHAHATSLSPCRYAATRVAPSVSGTHITFQEMTPSVPADTDSIWPMLSTETSGPQ